MIEKEKKRAVYRRLGQVRMGGRFCFFVFRVHSCRHVSWDGQVVSLQRRHINHIDPGSAP